MEKTADGFWTAQDTELMARVATAINEQDPTATAEVWHSGGGIFGLLLQLGDEREAFFGTADETWGADVLDSDGDTIGCISTEVRADEPDVVKIAGALLVAARTFSGKA